jgi:hypothetical protein
MRDEKGATPATIALCNAWFQRPMRIDHAEIERLVTAALAARESRLLAKLDRRAR